MDLDLLYPVYQRQSMHCCVVLTQPGCDRLQAESVVSFVIQQGLLNRVERSVLKERLAWALCERVGDPVVPGQIFFIFFI